MQQSLAPQAMKPHKKINTLLVVEDDRGTGEMVKHIKPTLFLLDYHLATMTGVELYDILHATHELEHIPAIILTAEVSEKSINRIKQHQLVTIQEPFDVDEFLQVIEDVLI